MAYYKTNSLNWESPFLLTAFKRLWDVPRAAKVYFSLVRIFQGIHKLYVIDEFIDESKRDSLDGAHVHAISPLFSQEEATSF